MGFKTKRINADIDANNLNRVSVVNAAWDGTELSAIPAGAIVLVTGVSGIKLKVSKAANSSTGFMLTTMHEIRETGHATTGWFIKDMDTSGAAIQDPVYQSGSGEVSLVGAGSANVVGYVIEVGTEGMVALCPSQAAPRTATIWGLA